MNRAALACILVTFSFAAACGGERQGGVNAPVSWLLLRDIVATVVVNTLIALPAYAITRRWIEPALPDDPRRRRRRAYTTGGLSPLSRA